ncbi:MAG TPA: hypothetical protein VGE17_02190 [Methylophilus sp.]
MMKLKSILLTAVLAGLALSSTLANAHGYGHGGYGHGGFRGNFGFYFGGPGPFPYYAPPVYAYPYPYMYNPAPVVITQPQPQVYIEQGATAPAQPAAGPNGASGQYWYYCEQSATYYPYVKECPAGWKQVTPSPPPVSSGN